MSPATSWEALPDECWEIIFGRAGISHEPISRACKRFLIITNLSRATLTVPRSSATPFTLSRLYTRFPKLTHLQLSHTYPYFEGFVRDLARSNLPLQSLRFSSQTTFPREAMRLLGRSGVRKTLTALLLTGFKRLDDDDLFIIADCFSYLQRLRLDNEPFMEKGQISITDRGILTISIKLKSLRSLFIYCNKNITHQSFQCLSTNCPLLSDLKVKDSGSIGYVGCCIEYFASFETLSSLCLHQGNISERGLLRLSRANLKIQKLVLYCPHPRTVNAAAMCWFLKSCRSLRHLKMKYMSFSKDVKALDFVTSIPNVEMLTICNVSLPPTILFDLIEGCPKLEDLVSVINDVGDVQYSSDNLPINRQLRKLVLTGQSLKDEILMLIASICPNLEFFSIGHNSHITESGIKAIMAGCGNIEQLDVIGCENVKDFTWGNKRPRIIVST